MLPWWTLTARTEGQMCQWSTAFYISVFALTCPTAEMICMWMCCLFPTVPSIPPMLSVCWLTWLHAFGPPSFPFSDLVPLFSQDHGNVILHGNVSHFELLWKGKCTWLINSPMFFFSPCCSSFVSLVLPDLVSVVWSAVYVRDPGSPERWFSNGCGPALSSRAGPCASGYDLLANCI